MIEATLGGGDAAAAETLIFAFAEKGSPHAYWVAKAYIALGDHLRRTRRLVPGASYLSEHCRRIFAGRRRHRRRGEGADRKIEEIAMKRVLILSAAVLFCGVPLRAQVTKQVEVTKVYVPEVSKAVKLPIVPDMTDTVRLRPEIDYTVTPSALATNLSTEPFRPASVTYWEFNRPRPLYLKVGAGAPLNSVLDLYASTQNPGTGYAVGYLNHTGDWAEIRNDFGVRPVSWRSTAAGRRGGQVPRPPSARRQTRPDEPRLP